MSRARDLADSADLNFDDGTLVIDSGNNRVGIGTTSPVARLTASNSGALTLDSNDGDHTGFGLFLAPETISTNTVNSAIGFGQTGGRKYAAIGMQTYSDPDQTGLNFYVQPTNIGSGASLTEAMRLDASGNLLVGKTSASPTTAGAELRADGAILGVRSSDLVALFNRTGTDGEIISLRRSGTTVGSIGSTNSSTNVYVSGTNNSNTSGLEFATAAYLPMTNSSRRDATVNLGSSSWRYNDAYLSGGVYLGGTGSANKLDDYEEGTASLTMTGKTVAGTPVSVTMARYTKVGRTVHLEFTFNGTSAPSGGSGNIVIGGLPFVLNSSGPYNFPVSLIVFQGGGSALTPRMVSLREDTTTSFFVQHAPSAMNVDVSNIQVSDLGGSNYIRASISYTTSA